MESKILIFNENPGVWGQNDHIWAFGAQNAKIDITLVKNNFKKSLSWKRINKVLMELKNYF